MHYVPATARRKVIERKGKLLDCQLNPLKLLVALSKIYLPSHWERSVISMTFNHVLLTSKVTSQCLGSPSARRPKQSLTFGVSENGRNQKSGKHAVASMGGRF